MAWEWGLRCVVWQSGFGGGVGWVGQQEGRVQWQFRFGCMEQWAVGWIGWWGGSCAGKGWSAGWVD